MPLEISIMFNSRIVAGVYKYDIVIVSQPYLGAVVGSVICAATGNFVNIPAFLSCEQQKIEKMCIDNYQQMRQLLGD